MRIREIIKEYVGVESNPNFMSWFGKSKVVNSDGSPMVVYHGTKNDFDTFSKGDIGYHAGGKNQANNRLAHSGDFEWSTFDKEHHESARNSNILPLYMRIENPLKMKDIAHWDDLQYCYEEINNRLKGRLDFLEKDITMSSNDEGFSILRKALEKFGYDGIMYENLGEGKGISYIAFNPNQIKSAIGNNGNFSSSNKITESVTLKNITLYHGSNVKFQKVDMSMGSQGVFWLTSNLSSLKNGERGANSTKYILKCKVTLKNPAGWNEYHKYSLGELKRMKYDGVILPDSDGTVDVIVFRPSQVKILGEG